MTLPTNEDAKLLKRLGKTVKINPKIDLTRVPAHVAFIMDGNGRWAKRRGMPRQAGHAYGYRALQLVLRRCVQLGIRFISIYAFSTENWDRPQAELDEIFRVVRQNMTADTPEFNRLGVRVVASGDITRFPQDLQDALTKVISDTASNDKATLNVCINYGGRADIVQAVNRLTSQGQKLITEYDITRNLYTGTPYRATATHTSPTSSRDSATPSVAIPDPDLIIRTSGEQRISNFMLWQMAYSELLFTREYWPSVTEKTVDNCIIEFQSRNRRFGKV